MQQFTWESEDNLSHPSILHPAALQNPSYLKELPEVGTQPL
jgi:hypothetical protein